MKIVKRVNGVRTNWPFNSMAVGKSLLVKDERLHNTARSLAHYYGRRLDRKYTAKLGKSGLKIVRER